MGTKITAYLFSTSDEDKRDAFVTGAKVITARLQVVPQKPPYEFVATWTEGEPTMDRNIIACEELIKLANVLGVKVETLNIKT